MLIFLILEYRNNKKYKKLSSYVKKIAQSYKTTKIHQLKMAAPMAEDIS